MRRYRTVFLCSMVSSFAWLHGIEHDKLSTPVIRYNTAHVIDVAHKLNLQEKTNLLILSSDGERIIVQDTNKDNQSAKHYSYSDGTFTLVNAQGIDHHEQLRLQQAYSHAKATSARTYYTPHYSVSVNALHSQLSIKDNGHGYDLPINPRLEEGSHCACTEVNNHLIIAHYYPSHNKMYLTDATQNKYWKRGMLLRPQETLVEIAFIPNSKANSCSLAALIASRNKLTIELLNCHFHGKTLSTEPCSRKTVCSIDEMYEDDTHAPGMAFSADGTHGAIVNRIAHTIRQVDSTCKQVRVTPQTIYAVHTFNYNGTNKKYYSHECRVAKQLSDITISSIQITNDGTKVLCDGLLFDMQPQGK